MDRDSLVGALRRADPTFQECGSAVVAGAGFDVYETLVPTTDLLTIYRRRASHLAAIGVDHGGFDEARADLEGCESKAVRLGAVTDRVERRHYQLFVSADVDDVIACLWVHRDPDQ